ncbi:hypothetical protein BLA24_14380 [Streptomyces cinnamoneus]|uniref:Lipoprotein n=1 Tax=Streptomyces cinnamoneus TaxID=53446 RepID=A0A2G1XIC8_STRCJ|nr:hypothetical protein [Streptomyces cinnamoneus]PHQ50977.1 hypothetical protein BLA24_14380 [Streptomyces cinnamoneus]PPT13801.1 hypothetical protein CYQ11_13695 [Streptomyces cinnamoneus]
MRKAVQITGAALIAAVLMTGCSKSSDDKGGDKGKETGATAPADPAKQPSGAPAADKPANVKAADLSGGWSKGKLSDQSLLILSFASNTVMLSGKTACSGKVNDTAQPVTLDITHCQDGSTEYGKGTVKSFDGKSLTISWASGKEDTLTKTVGADGKPAGLPAGLPTNIPVKPAG